MKNDATQSAAILGIGRVVLRVRDLGTSRRFYEGLLAHDGAACNSRKTRQRSARARSNDTGNGNHASCAIAPSRNIRVADQHGEFVVQLREGIVASSHPGIDHFCLRAASLVALRRIYARAVELGAEVTDLRLEDHEWRFFVYDPDGHKIGVYAEVDSPDHLDDDQQNCSTDNLEP